MAARSLSGTFWAPNRPPGSGPIERAGLPERLTFTDTTSKLGRGSARDDSIDGPPCGMPGTGDAEPITTTAERVRTQTTVITTDRVLVLRILDPSVSAMIRPGLAFGARTLTCYI